MTFLSVQDFKVCFDCSNSNRIDKGKELYMLQDRTCISSTVLNRVLGIYVFIRNFPW